jgi:enoyl-CoA hydratase/carnithine racemase
MLVLAEIKHRLGVVTLNSEQTLNALSLPMIRELATVLRRWMRDDTVACVLLKGAGEKAFCAGGDVRKLRDAIIAGRVAVPGKVPPDCVDFFAEEYRLDYLIHRYPKPIIVWGDGIVMGGGIGLLAGASHRVVTEKSKLAMPEITIGLYPDVGGTYFLNRMPSAFGLYLGMTGTRLNGADILFLGWADFLLSSAALDTLLQLLESVDWSGDAFEAVSAVLRELAQTGPSVAADHAGFVQLFESVGSVDEFAATLLTADTNDEWIAAGVRGFAAGSPSSAHIIFRQLSEGRASNLEDAFRSELNLSCQCCLHPDLVEGVRALLVDKDQKPGWQPASLSAVTSDWIDSYFSPLWNPDDHPLKDLGKNSGN